jgi:ribosome biogenesis GTPase
VPGDRRSKIPLPDFTELHALGYAPPWQALFARYAAEGLMPARVVRTDRGSALVATPAGVVRAETSARLRKAAGGPADLPAVGDWVAILSPDVPGLAQIEAVLARVSAITRGDPGKGSDVQVLAANVDTVLVVHPIVEPPNLRRIERELSLAWDSGATPVVVLTKADLSADVEVARAAVESVALDVDVLVVNALTVEGVEPLLAYVSDERTAVLIGPSGVGKSTLINTLLGEQRQKTRTVRVSDGRGQHTTVARELFQMPGGGVLIDTPGLRALGLTGSQEGISSVFPDIGALARACRFRDCTHVDEPGCAVRAAAESGELAPERLASYLKLVGEAHLAATKADARLQAHEDGKRKTGDQAATRHYPRNGGR